MEIHVGLNLDGQGSMIINFIASQDGVKGHFKCCIIYRQRFNYVLLFTSS